MCGNTAEGKMPSENSLSAATEKLKEHLLMAVGSACEQLGVRVDPGLILIGMDSDGVIVNAAAASFADLGLADLAAGADVGLVYLNLPAEDIRAHKLQPSFYKIRVEGTYAQLVDASGKTVADSLPVTITPGDSSTQARRSVDAVIRRRQYQFSYEGPRLKILICVGRNC